MITSSMKAKENKKMFHYSIMILFSLVCTGIEGRPTSTPSPSSPPKQSLKGLVPAIYVFGDSLIDNGNNNNLGTVSKANYLPYGIDFPTGVTGRFSNGRTIADFISEAVGIPYEPAYMTNRRHNWLTGYNYASSGCGILDESGKKTGKCYEMDRQIEMFDETISEELKKHFTDKKALSDHLSKSLMIVVIGNNDYLNNYLNPIYIKYKNLNKDEFAELLISRFSQQLKRVYELGGRKFLMGEVAPLGCTPFCNRTNSHTGPCSEKQNDIIRAFNMRLEPLVANLRATLPGTQFVVAKLFKLVRDVVISPTKYGFENGRDPCCKAMLNDLLKCKRRRTPCKNRTKYCFWDAFHPTEALISYAVNQCLTNTEVCAPLNLRQLLQA